MSEPRMIHKTRVRRSRIALAAILALGLFGAPPTASAGTYTVRACYVDAAGVPRGNSSWAYGIATPWAGTNPACGTNGLGVWAASGGGLAPPGSARAFLAFNAAPDTTIWNLSAFAQINVTKASGWSIGLYDNRRSGWLWCGPTDCLTGDRFASLTLPYLNSTQIYLLAVCGDPTHPCPMADQAAWLKDITVTLYDKVGPTVDPPSGGLFASGWIRGNASFSANARDNTGIRRLRVLVDGAAAFTRPSTCDETRAVPCPNAAITAPLPTSGLADGRHVATVEATDSGSNVATADRAFWTDNHAPARPNAVAVEGGAVWRQRNGFTVSWTNPHEEFAPIEAVHYRLCPASDSSFSSSACVAGEQRARDVGAIANLNVPGAGTWHMKLWLEDLAGNSDPERVGTVEGLRFDAEPPAVRLRPTDARNPTLISATAADADSGLATTEIELRRRGSREWQSLPVTRSAGTFSASVDDEGLADGVYDIRARATDQAGNERTASVFPDGEPAAIGLPVRIGTRIAVGSVKRVRDHGSVRRVLVVCPRARYGRTISLTGRLTMPGANPVPGADVEVWERPRLDGSAWHRIAVVRTAATGRFVFRALRGPSRFLRFRYTGTATVRPSTGDVELRIAAVSTLGASRRSVVNGEDVVFRGKIQGGNVPTTGKLIQLQVYSRGKWLTFATPHASARDGVWRYRYRFVATRGHVRYRFRARLPAESGYPFEPGVSPSIHVLVRGL